MNNNLCICGSVAKYSFIGMQDKKIYNHSVCRARYLERRRESMQNHPTHIRLKTGKRVVVERHEGGTVVVRGTNGSFIGSYEPETMAKFYQRYKSLTAGKVKKGE